MKALFATENNDSNPKRSYLDHAATSFPKAPGVGDAMRRYVDDCGMNAGRGAYLAATEAEAALLDVRERLCRLFHFPEPSCAILTPGQTYSLNFVLAGLLRPGDHVVVSALEHNAVMRPLQSLAAKGVSFSCLPCAPDGTVDPAALPPLLQKNTRLVAVTHASNVCGTLLPIADIGALCRAHGIPLLLDAAQTAGHVPIDFTALGLSALAVPGHKGLLGPAGIGALLLEPAFADRLSPVILGGTGSASDSELPPRFLPDRLEPGTPNLPGVFGLRAALDFILQTGVESFGREEMRLTRRLLFGLSPIPGVRIVGKPTCEGRVGVVSIATLCGDSAEIADRLDREFGVMVRCGLHCAPRAHRALGTFPAGAVRFSIGFGNTEADIDRAVEAMRVMSAG